MTRVEGNLLMHASTGFFGRQVSSDTHHEIQKTCGWVSTTMVASDLFLYLAFNFELDSSLNLCKYDVQCLRTSHELPLCWKPSIPTRLQDKQPRHQWFTLHSATLSRFTSVWSHHVLNPPKYWHYVCEISVLKSSVVCAWTQISWLIRSNLYVGIFWPYYHGVTISIFYFIDEQNLRPSRPHNQINSNLAPIGYTDFNQICM